MRTLSIRGKFIFIAASVLLCLNIEAIPCLADVKLFNDKVIGKPIGAPVTLATVVPLIGIDELMPNRIEAYLKDGKYIGAVVYYPFSKSNFQNIEKALNILYKGSKQKWIGNKFKYWRIDERKVGVSLTYNEPCKDKPEDQHVFVTYKILQ